MRTVLYLLLGLVVAMMLGMLYVWLSTPIVPTADATALAHPSGGGDRWLMLMVVTGFFAYLQYPNNTLADGAYAGFWCAIASCFHRPRRQRNIHDHRLKPVTGFGTSQ